MSVGLGGAVADQAGLARSALVVLIGDSEGGFLRSVRSVRILRPLRAIQRSRGMRLTVAALLNSVPAILTVAGCLLFFCSVTAILMVQLFKGTMYHCTDESRHAIEECFGSAVLDGAIAVPLWENNPQNFDSFNNALLTLFELFTLEAWPDIMLALVDATDEYHGPKRDEQEYVVFLFLLLITLGAFFLMNLFVGVIVTAYNEAQHIEPMESASTKEINHVDALGRAREIKPKRLFHTELRWRQKLVLLITNRTFEMCTMGLIVLNILVMCVDWVRVCFTIFSAAAVHTARTYFAPI